jgi:hypothetical protein
MPSAYRRRAPDDSGRGRSDRAAARCD